MSGGKRLLFIGMAWSVFVAMLLVFSREKSFCICETQ